MTQFQVGAQVIAIVTCLILHTHCSAPNDSAEELERAASNLFGMKHHWLQFILKHYPVNYSASGTSAQASQISVCCKRKKQEAIVSELDQAMLLLLESQSCEMVFSLSYTTPWYCSMCTWEYN